jgi:hypothetical protein
MQVNQTSKFNGNQQFSIDRLLHDGSLSFTGSLEQPEKILAEKEGSIQASALF